MTFRRDLAGDEPKPSLGYDTAHWVFYVVAVDRADDGRVDVRSEAFANLTAPTSSSACSSRTSASGYTGASSPGYSSADWNSVFGTVGSVAQLFVPTILYALPLTCHAGHRGADQSVRA